jgi:hypothetical protein
MAGTAAGVRKQAAQRIGISLDEYERRLAAGERWCFACRAWHPRDAFHVDRSRSDGLARACKESRNRSGREKYEPVPDDQRRPPGPPPNPPRDGDTEQARQRINVLVRTGKIPHPNELPCADCGHVYVEGERRHEYDHHLGYAAEHHYDVEAVCTVCHTRRGEERGEIRHARGHTGRYVRAS